MKYENNLKTLRKNAGLTYVKLAEKTELSDRRLKEYELGNADLRTATLTTLSKLAIALNCRVQDLFNQEDTETLKVFKKRRKIK